VLQLGDRVDGMLDGPTTKLEGSSHAVAVAGGPGVQFGRFAQQGNAAARAFLIGEAE